METFVIFIVAFIVSFIGTIPPGTLNLTAIQLGLENKLDVAWRFTVAACFVEYFYAWAAVAFAHLITSSPVITERLELIAAIVMITLGILNIWAARRPTKSMQRFADSGIRRGLLLGVFNPLAMPFWIVMTAYLKSQGWISLSSDLQLHVYLLGVFLGAVALLMLVAYLARKVVLYFQQSTVLKQVPGYTLIILGVYAFIRYLL